MAEEIKIVGLANPKRSVGVSFKIIGAIVGIIVLALGVMAGIYLVGQQQDIREEAATQCPGIEACPVPNEPTLLINCTPTEEHSTCSSSYVGRLEMCGGAQYCCNGTSWSSNLSACAVSTPTPSPTASASPSPTPTRSPSPTPTAAPGSTATPVPTNTAGGTVSPTRTPTTTPTTTSVSQATSNSNQATSTSSSTQATSAPIPETGASWQTILGGGIGLVVIIASLVLAL